MELEENINKIEIDFNSDDFFNKVQNEVEIGLAGLKKNIELMNNLRITAVESEVEAAALYHAEFFYHIEQLEATGKELNSEVAKVNSSKEKEQ